MAKKYCQCGAATEYTLEVPKFCAGCGASYTAAFITAKQEKPTMRLPKKKKVIAQLEEDDEDDSDFYDDEEIEQDEEKTPRVRINKSNLAAVEIQGNKYQSAGKLKDLAGTQQSGEVFRRETGPKLSKKKALENVRSMATPKRVSHDIK